MRPAYLTIVAMLLITPAGAQTATDCSGATMSELSDCVALQAEQAAPARAQAGSPRISPIRPAQLGGSWNPVNLRVAPPLAAPPLAGGRSAAPVEAGSALPQGAGMSASRGTDGRATYDASQYYEVNGQIVRIDPDTREIIEVLGPANRGAPPNAGIFPAR